MQVKKFLATAAWLTHRGQRMLSTGMISRALKDNQQRRLGNPSDCLGKNIAQGFCEKDGSNFFVTTEGWKNLGEER